GIEARNGAGIEEVELVVAESPARKGTKDVREVLGGRRVGHVENAHRAVPVRPCVAVRDEPPRAPRGERAARTDQERRGPDAGQHARFANTVRHPLQRSEPWPYLEPVADAGPVPRVQPPGL